MNGASQRIEAFRREYRRAIGDLLPLLTPDRIEVLGEHNPGWGAGYDVRAYLEASEVRYVQALELAEAVAPSCSTGSVLDIGGFMGAFPLALARTGAKVTLSEKYDYYYGAFDPVRDLLVSEGISVWDADLTEPFSSSGGERFDLVTAMAIIEHLANSPRPMLENARELLGPRGRLLIEAPNVAYWPKRIGLLLWGQSPLAPIKHVYDSKPPFTGHHHEYTQAELRDVLEWTGMEVEAEIAFNYTPQDVPRLWRPLISWPSRRKNGREVLMSVGRKSD